MLSPALSLGSKGLAVKQLMVGEPQQAIKSQRLWQAPKFRAI